MCNQAIHHLAAILEQAKVSSRGRGEGDEDCGGIGSWKHTNTLAKLLSEGKFRGFFSVDSELLS